MAKKKQEQIELPLIKRLRQLQLDDKLMKIPDYIKNNLKHKLRYYQENALINLDYYQKHKADESKYNHLLFNMATGSGKTDLMAALILYMFVEFEYQNFLFVVNSTAILDKTRDNLINSNSLKYLFEDKININGNNIEIKEVNNFPVNKNEDTIYLKLTTIQSLANEINSPRENGLTLEDLAKEKMVILGDEAHHLNASTKSELKKDTAWEILLDKLRNVNEKNKQFEFTATLNLSNSNIYNKYKDKIVYKYDLSSFISDGYSKNVYRLESSGNDEVKMLNAILLSQYRKHLAKELGIPDFKPVILFKSERIDSSNEYNERFNELIENLNTEKLSQFLNNYLDNTDSNILKMCYKYWLTKNLIEVVREIKRDFSKFNILNANDSGRKGIDDKNTLYNLNTIDNINNPFRVVFAVAKLNEGWDVLNLYDIVRMNGKVTKGETEAEAQLIGRGARYYPFEYQGNIQFERRFDEKEEKYKLLERLYYHTLNEPDYLKKLNKALSEIDLPIYNEKNIEILSAKVKEDFKTTSVYKKGSFFYNLTQEIKPEQYTDIKEYGIDVKEIKPISIDSYIHENNYTENKDSVVNYTTINLGKISHNKALLKKGMARNKFFRFSKIKEYLPNISTMDELFEEKWLGNFELYVNSTKEKLDKIEQLEVIDKFLNRIQKQITTNYRKQKGTNRFTSIKIKDIITDYEKIKVDSESEINTEKVYAYPMEKDKWFPYDTAIVNGHEYKLIQLIKSHINTLKKMYKEVYLFRINEQKDNVKLHDFGRDFKEFAGFVPDFILYLGNPKQSGLSGIYQLYIEPKGSHLVENDSWKENLLGKITPETVEILEDKNIKLYGMPFYLEGDSHGVIEKMKKENILQDL